MLSHGMKDENILDILNLKTYFYTEDGIVKAVDDVSLSIKKNEVHGLVGESGCGKSTVALSILRLIEKPGKIVGGKIIFDGENILEKKDDEMRSIRGSKISIVFQDPTSSLNPVFNIENQLAEVIELHQKLEKFEIKGEVVEMLKNLRIPDAIRRLTHYPHEFSSGMKQRIMIAMALLCQPKLLIADEPTTALDVTIQAQILDLMKELRETIASSVLLITHNLGVVAELADRVSVMYAGKIVESSDSVTIFKNSAHPYTRSLVESVPRVDLDQEVINGIPGNVPSLIDPPPGCRFSPRCDYATEICSEKEPLLKEFKAGHLVACFHADEMM